MKKILKAFGLVNILLLLVAIGLGVYVLFIEPDRLVLNEKTLTIEGWDKELDEFKIVAISDLHGGASFIDEEKIRDVVKLANTQEPDLIVLLGDFVSQKSENKPITRRSLKMPMATVADNLKGLRAKHGVVAVLGNHDGWYDDKKVTEGLESVGITVLVNEILTVEKNGKKINIFGLEDHLRMFSRDSFRATLYEKLDKLDNDGKLIILEHNPDVIPMVAGRNSVSDRTKLFIAGHTHGGQVWFPLFGSLIVPSEYGDKYAFGHIKEGKLDAFVTTGVGTSVMPIRFLVPPEVAVLTIRSK